MNKNLLLITILTVVIILAFIGMFFLGRGSIKPPQPSVVVTERIHYDTATVIRKVFINKVQYILRPDSTRVYADSVMGKQNEVDYKIKHTLKDSNKVLLPSIWEVNIEPRFRTITKIITRDSIQVKVNNVYLQVPFFLNPHFWGEIILVVITALAIIF